MSGFMAAGFGAAADTIDTGEMPIDVITHAVAGGVGSVLGGGKFADGAVTAAFGYLFNDLLELQHTASASGMHMRVAVTTDNGDMEEGMSFGIDNDTDNPYSGASSQHAVPTKFGQGNGVVYESIEPSTGTSTFLGREDKLYVSSEEAKAIVGYMESRYGDRAPYNVFTNNCRQFSLVEFFKIEEAIFDARSNHTPIQIPSRRP